MIIQYKMADRDRFVGYFDGRRVEIRKEGVVWNTYVDGKLTSRMGAVTARVAMEAVERTADRIVAARAKSSETRVYFPPDHFVNRGAARKGR